MPTAKIEWFGSRETRFRYTHECGQTSHDLPTGHFGEKIINDFSRFWRGGRDSNPAFALLTP
jgi:hypothetical protein